MEDRFNIRWPRICHRKIFGIFWESSSFGMDTQKAALKIFYSCDMVKFAKLRADDQRSKSNF